MCVVSMMIDYGLSQPRRRWNDFSFRTDMGNLLAIAADYDVKNNQPDCELDEKRKALEKLADELGIEIKFPNNKLNK